jgi:hypothetical protein
MTVLASSNLAVSESARSFVPISYIKTTVSLSLQLKKVSNSKTLFPEA